MKRISKEELPVVLTDDVINILAHMANETPQSKEWIEIFDILSNENYLKIEKRRSLIQRTRRDKRINDMTSEELIAEKNKWKKINDNVNEDEFYGNMGEPQTAEEYKQKYGVYPPDYKG
jgi:hypothetical protein